jgi:hypothetical protein
VSSGDTTIIFCGCGSRIRATFHAPPVTSNATRSVGIRLPASTLNASCVVLPRIARLTADATRILDASIIQTYTPNNFGWESLVEPDMTDGSASP